MDGDKSKFQDLNGYPSEDRNQVPPPMPPPGAYGATADPRQQGAAGYSEPPAEYKTGPPADPPSQPTAPPMNGINGTTGGYPHPEHRNGESSSNQGFTSSSTADPEARADQGPTRRTVKIEDKSLLEAYILWFPLGIIGLHQFYLGRIGMGFLYFFTLGIFGIGWLVDLFRMPYLVRQTNEKRRRDAERGYILYAGRYELEEKSLCTAYLFWIPPVGILGGHHYYLGNILFGLAYTFTLGIFGFGWLIDFCRLPFLTRRVNKDMETLRSGRPLSQEAADHIYLSDAYILAFPLGFLGLHHFYLRRWGFGIVYFLTLGLMGVGFLVDIFRLPCLLNRAKRELRTGYWKFHLDDAYLLWFPLGFLGLHHFYLRRWVWGIGYFLTLGFFGIGWLIDLCRLPILVRRANEYRESQQELLQHEIPPGQTGSLEHPGQQPYPSPQGQYTSSQEYGYPYPEGGQGYQASGMAANPKPPAPPGAYGAAPSFMQPNVSAYAFPLDQHGRPLWSEGVSWSDEQRRETFQSQFHQQPPNEPPPPYTQY